MADTTSSSSHTKDKTNSYFYVLFCCCFGYHPCFIPCFKIRESTATRVAYILILINFIALAGMMHDDSLYSKFYLKGVPKCSSPGYISVYRILLPLAFFHFILFFVTIPAVSSHSITGRIHNAFWLFKASLLLLPLVIMFTVTELEKAVYVWLLVLLFHAGTAAIYVHLLYSHYGRLIYCGFTFVIVIINLSLTILLVIISSQSSLVKRYKTWFPSATIALFASFKTFIALREQPTRVAQRNVHSSLSFWLQSIWWLHNSGNYTDFVPQEPDLFKPDQDGYIINICISQNSYFMPGDWRQDLMLIATIVFVILWTIYGTFQTTRQSERLGILPANSKVQKEVEYCRLLVKDRKISNTELVSMLYNRLHLPKIESFRRPAAKNTRPVLHERCVLDEPDVALRPAVKTAYKVFRNSTMRCHDKEEIYEALSDLNDVIIASNKPERTSCLSLSSSMPDLTVLSKINTQSTDKSGPAIAKHRSRRPPKPKRLQSSVADLDRRQRPKSDYRPSQEVKFAKGAVNDKARGGRIYQKRRGASPEAVKALIADSTGPVRRSPGMNRVQRRIRCASGNFFNFNTLHFNEAKEASELISKGVSIPDLLTDPEHAEKAVALMSLHDHKGALRQNRWLIFDEYVASVYSYPWFHAIFCISALSMMGQLTNWFEPENSTIGSRSWTNVWMTMSSAWLALFFYAMSLYCPWTKYRNALMTRKGSKSTAQINRETEISAMI
ncbi:Serine incorporator 5 [Cichlidogyrus casuarinus]|uniref:Serine incorporator 5 n=1 Tax=Cichlidogyrus casuarinus TaxID=1844966 RepID=A0ABD2QI94_9PLAT